MMPKKIKLFWQLGAVLAVLTVAGVAAAAVLPRMGVSDLYRRYKDNPHLAVTYLRNFPLADTLAVDVTTIQALDDEGWDTLKSNFNVKPVHPLLQEELNNGKDIIVVRLSPKSDPSQAMDTTNDLNNNVIGISHLQHSISIFNTGTKTQQDAVMNYNFFKQ